MVEGDEILAHWVGWRLVQRDGKPTKVPVDPKSGHNADTTDDRTWGDCESAIRAVEKFKLSGIGDKSKGLVTVTYSMPVSSNHYTWDGEEMP